LIGKQQIPQHGLYRAYLGNGNNSSIIGKTLKNRSYWVIVDNIDQETNLIWTQLPIKKLEKSSNQYVAKFEFLNLNNI
jgi:hypothetical protein